MDYLFDPTVFASTFGERENIENKQGIRFKLFPFASSSNDSYKITPDFKVIIGHFFRLLTDTSFENDTVCLDKLSKKLTDTLELEDEEKAIFINVLKGVFFPDGKFTVNNLKLFNCLPEAQTNTMNYIAAFLFDVLKPDNTLKMQIKATLENCKCNVIEQLIYDTENNEPHNFLKKDAPFFALVNNVSENFNKDLKFMLEEGITGLEDFNRLLSLYFFYYLSQVCFELDSFTEGKRRPTIPLYFALDWEKISQNRKCCTQGWRILENHINNMFSHAVTLELLNQTTSERRFDYIELGVLASSSYSTDLNIANEIDKIIHEYCSKIGFNEFKQYEIDPTKNFTKNKLQELFGYVCQQFETINRKAAKKRYNGRFLEYCKSRWLKNRKRAGWILNLKENDILFLTKLCIQNGDMIRLNDLFTEFESRGIFLDNGSKENLQDYFLKLNLIDKKSDSGDAQYVKRIL